jgi:hypothetical protein
MRTADIKTSAADYLKMKYYVQIKTNLFPLSLLRGYTFVFATSFLRMRSISNNMKIPTKM